MNFTVFLRCGLWEVMFFTWSCCFLIASLEEIETNHCLIYLAYFHYNKHHDLWHIESYDLYILIHIVFSSSLNLFSNALRTLNFPCFWDLDRYPQPIQPTRMCISQLTLPYRVPCDFDLGFGRFVAAVVGGCFLASPKLHGKFQWEYKEPSLIS